MARPPDLPAAGKRLRQEGVDGRVVASFGRRHEVELAGGQRIDCVTYGKKGGVVVGDRVRVDAHQGVILEALSRASLLWRSDAFQQKSIAANVTQVLPVVAPRPTWYPALLDRCLLAAEAAGARAVIVLNKADLPEAADCRTGLVRFERLGYPVAAVSAHGDVSALRPHLVGQASVLVGQSGMGKSSLVNALLPEAAVRTGDISVALDSGRHTTTHARLHHLDDDSDLIDSPGLQEFGLSHLSETALFDAFIEFRPYRGQCRFHNCRHLAEPGCALQAAGADGHIDAARLALWRELLTVRDAARRY